METTDPGESPQNRTSQDDGGLWMRLSSDPVTDHTDSLSERPEEETDIQCPPPAVITRYYGVMDDEGADDVFIPPPPPSYMAPLLPADGSRDANVNDSSVTLANGAADATEAKANPGGLDWHHGEEQVMAAQNKVDEVIVSTGQTSRESMDAISPSEDSILPKDQDQTPMEERCCDPSGRHNQEITTGDEGPNEEHEDIAILGEGPENCWATEAEKEKLPQQVPSSTEENVENETQLDIEGDKTISEDICGPAETDSKETTDDVDCVNVERNPLNLSSLHASDEDFGSRSPPELCKNHQNTMDAAISQPEIPTETSNDDEEHVDTRSLNYTVTKNNWVRRESGACETQVSRLSFSEGSEEVVTKEEQEEDGGRRIATDIQQGEQLLQRLQMVQLRQDVCITDSPQTCQQAVQETKGKTKDGTEGDGLKAREGNLIDVDKREESRFDTIDDEGEKMNLMEKEENEKNEKDSETKNMSLSASPVQSEQHVIAKAEAGDSDDEQSDSWVPADMSPIDPLERSSIQVSLIPTCHRLSVAVTSTERQIQEETQGKQNLQRAGGLFNLSDNPDVLEIPFKTNISLEPLPTKDGPDQRSDWQFSQQKMKKEISQEIQRELVLVNQGKIPGGYSKGEVRQLKETKMLFEAFQQNNTEGPTRHHKPPTVLTKGHVYPSVLERTRSLELLSLKSVPVSRTHSLRLYKETEKSPDILRSRSPTGASRDKTRSSPYTKQKHTRLYKSMDSINTDDSVETRSKSRVGKTAQDSPLLKQNPFFKLRPALALQPEVEKDIREAKEREEELRRQRCTLYGEDRLTKEDEEESRFKPKSEPDVRKQSSGKLERVWPPPSKNDQTKSQQTQQEPKVHRAGGQKAPLWQRWESGMINGKPSKEKN